ncbi:MAG: SDR family NAD(P)-dependent oxidoreductase [Candidatus Binatia bacterium]
MAGVLEPRAAGGKRFKDKICIVTGAGQGIGRATAKRLGEEGGKIIVAERVEESANRTFDELREYGVEAIKVLADVSKFAETQRVMAEAVKAFGRIDVLVNVVGGTIWWQPYHKYTEEQVNHELERSLFPTMWCCLAALPIMVEQKSGCIVNLSSAITRGGLWRAPYAISKGGVEALTRALAKEYGRHGIRINAVAPGGTKIPDRITPRLMIRPGMMAQPSEDADQYYKDVNEDKSLQAIQRSAEPEEQAAAIAFLASADASYITGQVIFCTGDP